MPFKRKKESGGARENTGRAGSGEGAGDKSFSARSPEEKLEYFRKKMAISRQQASTPKKKVDRYSASTSQIDSSLASPSAKKERGRPLASPSSGPRTPTTRKRVSRDTIAKTKRAEEISVLRRGIAMERHHPELKDDEETEIAEGVVEPENILPKKLDFGEIKVEEIETTSRTEEKPHGEMSKSTYFRKLQKVSEVFQQVAVDWKEMADVGLNLLARSDNIINKDKMEITVSESDYRQHLKERFSSGQNKTITRKANYVQDALVECEEKEIILEDLLLKTVLDSSYCYIVMEKAGMVISDNLKPRYKIIQEKYQKIIQDLTSNRQVSSGPDRFLANRAALKIAQESGLSLTRHSDITLLAKVVQSTWRYARMILTRIKDGDTEGLFARDMRKDAIKATHWPEALAEFAKNPDNSRSVPGNESVSISYKVRAPKFILLKKRSDVIKEFKAKNPDCLFSESVLNREWPQNVKTPTERDFDRNVCPIHSNARRMEKALKEHGLLTDVPSSCRLMCSLVMCKKEGVELLEPKTWKNECATDKCANCPNFQTKVPENLTNKTVTVALWGNKLDPVKNKVINNIHDYTFTIGELAAKFDSELPKLTKHIFNAAKQWEACKATAENLKPHIVMTIEDYQQNISVSHQEETTTAHFSGNVVQIACYPVIIKFQLPGEEKSRKGGIAFLSEDRKHDFQQIEVFEQQVFKYLKEKYDIDPKIWHRWTDQCAAQYKSQFTVEKLRTASASMGFCQDCEVNFCFFEVGEGKNESDSLGSLIKLAYCRALHWNRDKAARTVPEIADLIRESLATSSEKLDFIEVKVVEPFEREKDPKGISVKGIQKIHHLTKTKEGAIVARELSCLTCILQQSLCDTCQSLNPVYTPTAGSEETSDEEEDGVDDDRLSDIDENEADYTVCEEVEELDEQHDSFEDNGVLHAPGSVVWARFRSWYPAKVCELDEIPNKYKNLIPDHPSDNVYVRRFDPFGDIKVAKAKNIDELGENRVDKSRASKSENINTAYALALATMTGDI